MAIVLTGSAKAQFRTYFDPFVDGDKYIGLSYSNEGWLLPDNVKMGENEILNSSHRSIINPGVVLQYRRVLENSTVHTANSFFLGFNHMSGEAEGCSASDASATWVTNYSYNKLFLTDIYMLMFQIGDDFTLDMGLGLTFYMTTGMKSSTSYSDGTTAEGNLGMSDFGSYLNAMLGAKYNLNDSFSVTCNFTANAFNLISLVAEDNPGMFTVREGMSASYRLPYQIMVGFLYAL